MSHRTYPFARRALRIVLGAALLAAPMRAAEGTPQATSASGALEYWSSKALPPGLPFSEAVQVGDLVFLSGQIGILPGTRTLAPGGIREEARQTMENIRSTLASRGYGLDRLVRCTVMLADLSEWDAFNEVYRTFFTGRFPARSAFGANGLALGARVEVECLAAVPGMSTVPAVPAVPPVPAAVTPAAPPTSAPPAAPAAPATPPSPAAPATPPTPVAPVAPVESGAAASQPTSLAASAWSLEEVRGRAVLSGVEATLDFAADGSASGRGPCNSFGGSVTITGDRIAFGPLRSTRKACANGAVNQLEGEYFAALAKSVRFLLEGDRLELLADEGNALLRFARRAP